MELYYLLDSAQKGDKESLAIFFKHFHPTIINHAKRLRYAEAETDLTIAFLEVINSIDRSRFFNSHNRDKQIAGFLHRILKNKSVDLFKKHVERHRPFEVIDYELQQDQKAHNFDNDICINMLVEALPPLQREIIKRKFIDGFSDQRIAEMLGVTRVTVSKNKNKGLISLRKSISEER